MTNNSQTNNHQNTRTRTDDDEISLRDLYLVLKRGLPLVVIVGVLFGVLGFVYFTVKTPSYQAESVTIITPASIEVQDSNGISFTPRANVSFETYETLATSRAVIDAVLAEFPELELDFETFSRKGEVQRLIGPLSQRPETAQFVPLSVSHTISDSDPAVTAALSNAWAESTLDTIRNSVLGTLSPVNQVTNSQLQTLQTTLDNAEDALRDFRIDNNLDLLAARDGRITNRVADTELQLGTLERQLAVSQVRIETLDRQFEAERQTTPTSNPTTDSFLAGRSIAEAQESISGQLEQIQTRRSEARAALDRFDEANNLMLLDNQIEELNRQVAEKEVRLEEIPGDIQRVSARILYQEERLASQPQLLELRDTILNNDVLSSVTQDNLDLATLLQTQLESEVVNPTHVSLLGNLIDNETGRENLQAEAQALQQELSEQRARLDTLRQQLIARQAEYDLLSLRYEQLNNLYAGLLGRAEQLDLAAQDSTLSTRTLRESVGDSGYVPPVLALERNLREAELSEAELRTDIAELRALLSQDQTTLAVLQREQAELSRVRQQLLLERDSARAAYDEIIKLQPLTSYITDLFPAGAQLLNEATVPSEPEGSRLLTTLLAGIIGGILALLFIFLRAAVAPPSETSSRPARSGQTAAGSA